MGLGRGDRWCYQVAGVDAKVVSPCHRLLVRVGNWDVKILETQQNKNGSLNVVSWKMLMIIIKKQTLGNFSELGWGVESRFDRYLKVAD